MRHPVAPDMSALLPVAFIPVVISLPIALFILHFLAIRLELSNSLSATTLSLSKGQTASKTKKNRTRSKGRHSRNISIGSIVATKIPPHPPPPPLTNHVSGDMSYLHPSSPTPSVAETLVEDPKVRQPYDALLVLDVEATCSQGVGFDFPNEIIEFPVVLLRWTDDGRASELTQVAEFRSYVRPTWRRTLTAFCTALTGITQADVDPAPTWPQVLESFEAFLAEQGLIDDRNGAFLQKFMFCSDGPFDVRDFIVKQCYISQIPVPDYFQRDVLDIRKAVTTLLACRQQSKRMLSTSTPAPRSNGRKLQSLNVQGQLHALGLTPFQGRQHSGIDDARNIARILVELARKPLRLEANTFIYPNRRWRWMTRDGTVDFPDYVAPYSLPEFWSPPLRPSSLHTAPPSPTLSLR